MDLGIFLEVAVTSENQASLVSDLSAEGVPTRENKFRGGGFLAIVVGEQHQFEGSSAKEVDHFIAFGGEHGVRFGTQVGWL